MSKDAPEAPDYRGAAEEQAAASREVTEQQTWANRPRQETPFGTVDWTSTPQYDPTTGQTLNRWTQTTTLDPDMQAALDDQQQLQAQRSGLAGSLYGRVANEYGTPPDWASYTGLAETPRAMTFGGGDRYSQEAEDALYGRFSSRMEPQFERQTAATRNQLYNMGLREGDEAFDRAMSDVGNQQTDARQQAMYGATIGAGQEAARMQGMDISAGQAGFGQQLTAGNYQNQLRQQQIAEDMQRRGYSLNEINALLTGQQVGMPNMPTFNTAQRSEGTQYLNAAQMQGQADLDRFNAQQQATQGMMSGIGSIAGGAMMFSDRRLKKDIELAWEPRADGLRWYKFRYIWEGPEVERHVGVMADEVLHTGAVVTTPSGFMAVDYEKLQLFLTPPHPGYDLLPVGYREQETQPWQT